METAYCGGLSTGGAGFFPPHLFWPAPLVSEEAAPVVEGMPARFRCAARRHGEGVPAHVCRAARGGAGGEAKVVGYPDLHLTRMLPTVYLID